MIGCPDVCAKLSPCKVWSTLDGRAWQRGSDAPWAARADFGLVATEDQIYLAGGTSCLSDEERGWNNLVCRWTEWEEDGRPEVQTRLFIQKFAGIYELRLYHV